MEIKWEDFLDLTKSDFMELGFLAVEAKLIERTRDKVNERWEQSKVTFLLQQLLQL